MRATGPALARGVSVTNLWSDALKLDWARTPSSPARLFPVSQYLHEPAFGVWVLECGVLTSPRA